MGQKIKLSEIRELVRKSLNESEIKEDKNPCWKGYEQIGMKMKNGKEVPNCVPIKEEDCSECEDKKIEEGLDIKKIDYAISNEKDSTKKNKLIKIRGNVLHKKQLNKSESDLAKEYGIIENKIIKLSEIRELVRKTLKESKEYDTYHDSFTSAAQAAREMVEKRGYTIDEDDWQSQVALNGRYNRARPEVGKTHRFTVGLIKDGKPQRKALTFTVYGMESGKYELTAYVN